MIQVYAADNINYDANGDTVLLPTDCTIEAELNGPWELTLGHPIDEAGRYKYIENGAVISAPSFVSDKQLFRIYSTIKADKEVTAHARPIFMDSAGEIFLIDTRPTMKNGQGALDEMLKGQTKYKGISDMATVSTAYYVRQNLIEAIQSDQEQSFLNRWGGEVWHDNYTVHILKRIGGDYGARAEMGHNCIGIESDIDMSEVVTRIVPVSYNGYMLDGDTPWVDSPLINNYPVIYTKEIKFEDVKLSEDAQEDEESFATLDLLRAELIKRCKGQFATGIDKPTCNYKCDMVELANTDAYADVRLLESVGLGDTVRCKNRKLEIETEGRAIKVTWDCILKRNKSVELGDFTYNYFNKVASTMNRVDGAIRPDGSIVAAQVAGIIDGVKSQMRAQSSAAKKSAVRALLFEDLDPESETFGAMCLGTMGFEIAGSRTADGRDWDWRTFGTGKGFFADLIVVGDMLADRIRGGTLAIGGATGKDGIISVLNAAGVEIGRWGKSGIDVKQGDISGTSITLGGQNNQNGTLKLLAADKSELVTLTNGGVYAKGKYVCGSNAYGRSVEISDGAFKIINAESREVGRLVATSDSWMRLECGNVGIRLMEDAIYFDAPNIGPGQSGKSGRVEFSDGTYLDFKKGFLTGGHTKEGDI